MANVISAREIQQLDSLSVTELAKQPAAICALAHALGDARPEVGQIATAKLAQMIDLHRLRPQHLPHGFPADARRALLHQLAHAQSAEARRIAAHSLCEAEQIEAIDGFIDGLADPAPEVRTACAQALANLRFGIEHLDKLATLLRDSSNAIKRSILDAIPPHIDRALLTELVPHLADLLSAADCQVRIGAARILASATNPPPALWPVLVESLRHGDAWQRASALRHLATLGTDGAAYVPAIIAAASDDNPAVRSYAITTLASLAPQDQRVLRILLASLSDASQSPRRAAVAALAAIDLPADALTEILSLAADEAGPGCSRSSAIEVLGTAGVASAVPVLVAALDSRDDEVREAAIDSLGCIGPDARGAAEALVSLLGSEDNLIAVATALIAMGADSHVLREVLTEVIYNGDDWSRHIASALLAELNSVTLVVRHKRGQAEAIRPRSIHERT